MLTYSQKRKFLYYRVKNILVRISRHFDSVNLTIAQRGFVIDKELEDLLKRWEETKKELDEVIMSCPDEIELEVKEFLRKNQEETAYIIEMRTKGSSFADTHFLKLYFTQTQIALEKTIEAIDTVLKK